MSERVLRLFEASGPKTSVSALLRQSSSSGCVGSELRSQLRPVGLRCVKVQSSGQPRLSAFRTDDQKPMSPKFMSPKSMLQGMAFKSKRAASASVFQRMRERLARFAPPEPAIPHPVRSLSSRVPAASALPRSSALRFH